jgi:hypothetical protein
MALFRRGDDGEKVGVDEVNGGSEANRSMSLLAVVIDVSAGLGGERTADGNWYRAELAEIEVGRCRCEACDDDPGALSTLFPSPSGSLPDRSGSFSSSWAGGVLKPFGFSPTSFSTCASGFASTVGMALSADFKIVDEGGVATVLAMTELEVGKPEAGEAPRA